MVIGRDDLKTLWYEDREGRQLCCDSDYLEIPEEAEYMVSCFPLELHKRKVKISDWKEVEVGEQVREKEEETELIYLGSDMEKIIVAMVNSGTYTLSEAILICTKACKRCCNVLAHTYTEGREGYKEFSEEWKRTNTQCEFCEKIENI